MKAPKPLYRKLPKRMLMAEEWDHLARAALLPGTPDIQRKEMRRAFYAGAEAMLSRVISAFSTEPPQIVTDLDQELLDFATSVKEGRA